MKRFYLLLLIPLLVLSCSKQQVLLSPDETLELSFRLTDDGAPQYCVTQDGQTVIDWSALGIQAEEADLTKGFRMVHAEFSYLNNRWETVWGEERWITDIHRQLKVSLKHASGLRMDILFRVFDDGFAFRYVFPGNNKLTVTDEASEYRFTADHEAWSIPWRTEYYEGLWTKAPLSGKNDTLCSPLTIERTDGGYAFVHEAALTDYPAQNLYMQDGALRTYLTPWLDNAEGEKALKTESVKAYVTAPF